MARLHDEAWLTQTDAPVPQSLLPEGWECGEDDDGDVYFVSPEGESQWEPPVDFAELAAVEEAEEPTEDEEGAAAAEPSDSADTVEETDEAAAHAADADPAAGDDKPADEAGAKKPARAAKVSRGKKAKAFT